MSINLVTWLKRAPKPSSLKYANAEGEERDMPIPSGRVQWEKILQTLRIAGAVTVQCISRDGKLLRAQTIDGDADGDGDEDEGATDTEKRVSSAMAKDRRELAAILESQGRAIERAYAAGAEAASRSNEALTGMVETLTNNLAIAITNLHNLSANYANAIQAQGRGDEEGAPNGVAQLASMLAPLLMGGMQAPAAPPAKPNGTTTPPKK